MARRKTSGNVPQLTTAQHGMKLRNSMTLINAILFATLFASAGLCQSIGIVPVLATPAPGAYSHVFTLRSPRNKIEYVPTIPSQGGWLVYIDDSYEQAAFANESLAPSLADLMRVMILPISVGDTKCNWEVKYALAPGEGSWWILLNPNVEDNEKPLVLRSAFSMMFSVATGQQPLPAWRLPACMDPSYTNQTAVPLPVGN
jgi:hypothetical protein